MPRVLGEVRVVGGIQVGKSRRGRDIIRAPLTPCRHPGVQEGGHGEQRTFRDLGRTSN